MDTILGLFALDEPTFFSIIIISIIIVTTVVLVDTTVSHPKTTGIALPP